MMKLIVETDDGIMATIVKNALAQFGEGVKVTEYKPVAYARGRGGAKPIVKEFKIEESPDGSTQRFIVNLSFNCFETRESLKQMGYKWNGNGKTWEKSVPMVEWSAEYGKLESQGLKYVGAVA